LSGTAPALTYTPAANYNGSDSFTFKANDGDLDSNAAAVSITLSAVNDAPIAVTDSYTPNDDTALTVAAAGALANETDADSYATNEDTALTVAAPGVLGNDTDVDSATLTAILVSGPAHGTLTLNSNGSFGYTPAANYNGSDSFSYKANDGELDSNAVTVAIT